MPGAPIRHSAIAARGSSARYNLNSWLDTRGALQTLKPESLRMIRKFDNAEIVFNRSIVD